VAAHDHARRAEAALQPVGLDEGLLKDDRFLEQYTLIEEIPTDYYGTGMLAFQRNDS
jgi:hypothetical protein